MFHQKKCSLAVKSRQFQDRDMKSSRDKKGIIVSKNIDLMMN